MVYLKNFWEKLKSPIVAWKEKRALKKRIDELRKRDPFIYK